MKKELMIIAVATSTQTPAALERLLMVPDSFFEHYQVELISEEPSLDERLEDLLQEMAALPDEWYDEYDPSEVDQTQPQPQTPAFVRMPNRMSVLIRGLRKGRYPSGFT